MRGPGCCIQRSAGPADGVGRRGQAQVPDRVGMPPVAAAPQTPRRRARDGGGEPGGAIPAGGAAAPALVAGPRA
eukprot:6523522-Pyramimonas_sp.AAC.1